MMMVGDSYYIPKANPAKPRGEDAYFFCPKSQVIGVADGVGGWSKVGVDAGEYARELMRNAAVKSVSSSVAGAVVNPKFVLDYAVAKTKKKGSSTATVISLAGNRLWAANVGDSGFVVIRDSKTIYRSPVQLHGFNNPEQVQWGSPSATEEVKVEVQIGDIVVTGTDGLFDNLFPDEVEATVERCLREGKSAPGMVARELAEAAHRRSLEELIKSPFSVGAEEAGISHLGGKKDDITVVFVKIENKKSNRKKIFNFVRFSKIFLCS